MTLARFTAKPLSKKEIKDLTDNVVKDFSGIEGLQTIILFGSAADGTMTDASDVDVVFVLDTKENVTTARYAVPELRRRSTWPMDVLFVDETTFKKKSVVGGVFFVAKNEGKAIFGKMP